MSSVPVKNEDTIRSQQEKKALKDLLEESGLLDFQTEVSASMMNARNQIPKDDWVGHYAREVARVYAERSSAADSPSAASKSSSAASKSSSAASKSSSAEPKSSSAVLSSSTATSKSSSAVVSSSSDRVDRNQPGSDLSRRSSSASGHGEPAASSGSSAPSSAGEWNNGIRRNGAPPSIMIPPSMNHNLKQGLNHMDIERELLMEQVSKMNFFPSNVNVLMYQQRHLPSRMGTNAGRMNDLDDFDHTIG